MPSKTLAQRLMRRAWNPSLLGGAAPVQSTVGLGKHLLNYGLPDSVKMVDGRTVFIDKDVTSPETTGEFISMPADYEKVDMAHEQRHADQADILGPLMIPARWENMLTNYGSGPLERDAYEATEPTSEFVRKPSTNGYTNLVQKILRATLR